ncbi:MAG: hypothetical protein FJ316_01235 [SAR202 cluster bacterium]|nr:hypothetical protein [SAR202 cluster bacterium]
MTDVKMLELANELLNRSKEGKVDWKLIGGGIYTVRFPESIRIDIMLASGGAYLLWLYNARMQRAGELIGDRSAPEIYKTLREIHELARRKAIDAEGVIDKALDYLKASAKG